MHKIFNKGNNNPIRKKITDRIDLFIKEMYNMARGDNMLTKFSVTNFRNFKDKLTIDFEDKHEYKFNEIATKNGIISKSIIFGKNGYGKSNLGFALFDIIITITDLHANSEVYDNNKYCASVETIIASSTIGNDATKFIAAAPHINLKRE